MQMHVARRLSEAIGSWLHFEFCCYRGGLFSENSLKAAVGNVLSSFPIIAKGARIHANFAHTALNPTKKSGRKREVDFALVLSGVGITKTGAEVLVETKWAGSSHCTPKTIFDDFLRLAILKMADPSAVCIFILAGNHNAVQEALTQMPFVSEGKKNSGIGASGSEKRLKPNDTNISHRKFLSESIKEFAAAGFSLPETFVTQSHGLHPTQPAAGTVNFQAIAWEVTSVSAKKLRLNGW